MKSLSLVVPVYNVAPFLAQCLESLAALTPAPAEIIVVDDGSTDDCPRILAEFAARLPHMKVVRQANGGLSAARNTGLAHARGDYLAFVDSDDFLPPDAYAEMLAVAEARNLDMVLGNAWYHFDGREPTRLIYTDLEPCSETSGAAWLLARLKRGRLLHMVWMHLYRRSFIEAAGLQFVPGLIHEDVLWTTEALLRAQRIAVLDRPMYYYRIRQRPMSPEQRDRHMQRLIESSVLNAEGLFRLAQVSANGELTRQLETQAVDGGFSVFHKLEQIADGTTRHAEATKLRQHNYATLLWQHAHGWRQRRRILRNTLRVWWWSR